MYLANSLFNTASTGALSIEINADKRFRDRRPTVIATLAPLGCECKLQLYVGKNHTLNALVIWVQKEHAGRGILQHLPPCSGSHVENHEENRRGFEGPIGSIEILNEIVFKGREAYQCVDICFQLSSQNPTNQIRHMSKGPKD